MVPGSLSRTIYREAGPLEPQSLPDTARAQVRQADRRLGMKPESIAEAADRLREEARIAMVGEKACIAMVGEKARFTGRPPDSQPRS